MKLMQVKEGRVLHWPEGFTAQNERVRGLPGHVIDLDAPCEAEWNKGQEHKLVPAKEGATADPITHPRAKAAIKSYLAKPQAAKQSESSKAKDLALPGIDEVPAKRGREKVPH